MTAHVAPDPPSSSIPKYTPLNLSTLQTWIDQGRIDPTQPITMKELVDSNAVGSIKDGVLLLGRVRLPTLFSPLVRISPLIADCFPAGYRERRTCAPAT